MARVTVVRAFAVKAEVVRRRHEERLEDISFRDVIYLRGHIHHSTDNWHRSAETENP